MFNKVIRAHRGLIVFTQQHAKQSFELHILEYDLTNCVFKYLKKMKVCFQIGVRSDFNVEPILK